MLYADAAEVSPTTLITPAVTPAAAIRANFFIVSLPSLKLFAMRPVRMPSTSFR